MSHTYHLTDDNYIEWWELGGKDPAPHAEMQKIGGHERNGRYLYQFINGEIIYNPQPYTPEQTEQLRKEHCQTEIRKLYSIDKEAQILREAFSGKNKDAFIEYDKNISNIIEKSKTMDFTNGGCI